MSDLLAAIDETAANTILHDAESALSLPPQSGSGSLGPFTAAWSASASLTGGTVTLSAPNIVHFTNVDLNYSVSFSLSIDLNSILPDFCLPQICIPTPWGDICTPQICISWPTITVPVSHSGTVTFSADFGINVHLTGGQWFVDVVILAIPSLSLDAEAAAIVAALGLAASAAMLAIPFIGPFLALAVAAITALIGIAAVTGLLGPILGLFLDGLTLTIYQQPQVFEVLPAGGPFDPQVNVLLNAVTADVEVSDKNELVLRVDV
ncbi:MAG TPA: hypothetical protein VEK76_08625 [Candidatus Binatia bacterium]|nr:hypothetical protein [Candidatus Binatia bacterium]